MNNNSLTNLNNKDKKPHAICIPFPAQGHINPMLKLASILHSKGFHITFVHNNHNYNRILRSYGPDALKGTPSFCFKAIPDGLPSMDSDSTQDIGDLSTYTERYGPGPFRELVDGINEDVNVPNVSCIVSDASMFFTVNIAKEVGVPEVLLWTASACSFLGYAHFEKLVDLGVVPFIDADFLTNGDLDTTLDWIPGMENIRLQDMPSFVRTTDPNEAMLSYVPRLIHHAKRAHALLFNSYDALEHDVLESLSPDFPPICTLGPLHLLKGQIETIQNENESLTTSLLKEDPHCLSWLDSHEPGSVVYVNFGSITVMTNDQLIEFAWGLANSKQPFLWITRPGLVSEDSAVLPLEFFLEVENRGLIASWCNQKQVLAHRAIRGFLTHCGWNSILESISNGVPMICWPFFADQQTNCWFCCIKWEIGIEIRSNVGRNVVERQVRELTEGDKGKEMKRKIMKFKELAQEANVIPNGSSYANFDTVIKILRSQN